MHLNQFLYATYERQSDEPMKPAGHPFTIGDVRDNEGRVVCCIQALVHGPQRFTLKFTNIPYCEAAFEILETGHGKTRKSENHYSASIALDPQQTRLLRDLADAFRWPERQSEGPPYSKRLQTCQRVADSLEQLADRLRKFNSDVAKVVQARLLNGACDWRPAGS